MKSSTFYSLFLGLILISQSPLSANARRLLGVVRGELVDELCSAMDDMLIKRCNNILGSNPEAMKAENYDKLSEVIITMAINEAVEGQKFLKGLAAATKSPALTECANSEFDSVVENFKNSLGDLKDKADAYEAVWDASFAHHGSDNCIYKMKAEKIVNPQVTALNITITLFSDMASFATGNLSSLQ
ncbi:hypothetical protein P8452_10123 [Trifolium repens]|nr:hypothetical protein P8452_10123 [Trifolium repens]